MMMRLLSTFVLFIVGLNCAFATDYYVSTSGNDASGTGTQASPWRTLRVACTKVAANQGHNIILSAGTFVETQINVPTGVNVIGAGIDVTIIKSDPSFYYNPASPGFSNDKFLILLNSNSFTPGNQSLKNFTVDGDGKRLHGGIHVRFRTNVLIEGVKVQFVNFGGIWLFDVKDSKLLNVQLKDCAWGSSAWASGALNLASLERVELDRVFIDEGTGYGVKALGSQGPMHFLKVHDCRFSVTPYGKWVQTNGASAPNIAFELWNVDMRGIEIYNNWFDNNLSLIMDLPQWVTPKGVQTVRVYNNVFDMLSRAGGGAYALEVSVHDIEIDHNYIFRGKWAIVNWDTHGNKMSNWNIHHNVFYGIINGYPGEIVRSQVSGLHNVKFYNNTVEFYGTVTANIVGAYGGASQNVEIKNNLILNYNTSYNWYPNRLVYLENATLNGLQVANNFLVNQPVGTVPGTYSNNLSGDPKITKSGNRPTPYYIPLQGSPLIDAGLNVGYAYQGNAPDIGAYEYGSGVVTPPNTPPSVSIASPANNATFVAGNAITINANAADTDGSVSRVEFFSGTTKLGEDLSNPHSFVWNNVAAGTYTLTAKATDDKGATTTSAPITVTVTSSNTPPTISLTGPGNNALFATGTTVTITANASDAGGTVSKVEFFSGTTKLGEDLSSPYSFAWNNVPAGNHTITAKATDDKNAVATSASIAIVVSTSNNPPTVSITGPANNATFNSGAPITITANASDANGSIAKVDFYNGTAKIAEDLSSPYSFIWTNAPAGTLSIKVIATDNLGLTATSTVVSITVNAAAVSPTVSLTSPTSNASFAAGTSITLTAAVTHPGGTIAKVEFYNGTTKLGEDLTSPYSFAWANAPIGTHSLGAKAIDSKNVSGNSALTQINVIRTNLPPIVNLTSPGNNSVFATNADITISATASDPDGTIAKVEFYNGNTKLGQDLTSPYNFVWNNVPNGNYTVSAKAVDNQGAAASSSIINIAVSNSTPPSVSITSPSNSESFFTNSTVTVGATATTPSGTVSKVEFFNGTTKLGEDLTSPYSFAWSNVPAGSHSLTAKATNSLNAVATSAAVNITVGTGTGPPSIAITSPAPVSTFSAGTTIQFAVTASNGTGAISRVEFFNGSSKLGEDLTSPFAFTWNNVAEGTYLITAMATDDQGATASDEVEIFVNPQNISPKSNAGKDLNVQLPVNSLTIQGTGTDQDGVITTYVWTQVTGPDDPEFTQDTFGQLNLGTLIEGTYVFELTVTDNGNATAKDQVTIDVLPSLLSLEQIPRYFSPNSDGVNDFWVWPRIELYQNSELSIFNRFGEVVYKSNAYQNNWDGTINGKPLQADAYYYVIRLSNTDIKGAVRIVR
jgi:gliding motility-associated-like protein